MEGMSQEEKKGKRGNMPCPTPCSRRWSVARETGTVGMALNGLSVRETGKQESRSSPIRTKGELKLV